MRVEIIPAIIAKSQQELSEKLRQVENYSRLVQLDVMDGIFVANKSINFDFKLPETGHEFEAHLMVKNPDEWVKKNWQKVDTVLVPIESCRNPQELIGFLKSKKKRAGFAINPETPLEKISDFLDSIDQVLIMTVNPGFYGGKFLAETLEKVRELRKLKPEIDIEVDGGITPEIIETARGAGANLFASGSYIFTSQNIGEAIKTLKNRAALK